MDTYAPRRRELDNFKKNPKIKMARRTHTEFHFMGFKISTVESQISDWYALDTIIRFRFSIRVGNLIAFCLSWIFLWSLCHCLESMLVKGEVIDEDAKEGVHQAQAPWAVEAYDCRKPLYVQDTSFEKGADPCAIRPAAKGSVKREEKSYQILYEEEKARFVGYRCKLSMSRLSYFCGMHHHSVIDDQLTHMEKPVEMTVEECRRAVDTKLWAPRNKKQWPPSKEDSLKVLAPGHNYFQIRRAGSGAWRDGDKIYCQGTTYTSYEGGIETRTAGLNVREEYRLDIEEVDMIGNIPGNTISTKGNGIELKCAFTDAGCSSATETFIWDKKEVQQATTCQLTRVREFKGEYWVANHTDKDGDNPRVVASTDGTLVRFVLGETMVKCGRKVHATNYDNIFLYEKTKLSSGEITRVIHDGNVNLHQFIKNRDDVLYHSLLDVIEDEYENVLQMDCRQKVTAGKTQYWLQHATPGIVNFMRGNGTFSTVAGEVLWTYQCPKVIVYARNADRCYQALPVVYEGNEWFVEPLSHRLTKHGIVQPCSEAFRPKYQAASGQWIMVAPTIHETAPPALVFTSHDHLNLSESFTDRINEARQKDFSKEGVFTDEQLEGAVSYMESGRRKEATGYQFSSQLRTDDGTVPEEIGLANIFTHVIPGFGWLTDLIDAVTGVWTTAVWYATVWSVFMSFWMTFQFFNSCLGVPYKCFSLHQVHGCSRELSGACCPDFLFMRAYQGMHRENQRLEEELRNPRRLSMTSFALAPTPEPLPRIEPLTKFKEATAPRPSVEGTSNSPSYQHYPLDDLKKAQDDAVTAEKKEKFQFNSGTYKVNKEEDQGPKENPWPSFKSFKKN